MGENSCTCHDVLMHYKWEERIRKARGVEEEQRWKWFCGTDYQDEMVCEYMSEKLIRKDWR